MEHGEGHFWGLLLPSRQHHLLDGFNGIRAEKGNVGVHLDACCLQLGGHICREVLVGFPFLFEHPHILFEFVLHFFDPFHIICQVFYFILEPRLFLLPFRLFFAELCDHAVAGL